MAPSAHLRHLRTVLAVVLAYVLGLQAVLLAATPAHGPVGSQTVLCTQSGGGQTDHGSSKHDHTCCTAARCGAVTSALAAPMPSVLVRRVAIRIGVDRHIQFASRDVATRRTNGARGPPLSV